MSQRARVVLKTAQNQAHKTHGEGVVVVRDCARGTVFDNEMVFTGETGVWTNERTLSVPVNGMSMESAILRRSASVRRHDSDVRRWPGDARAGQQKWRNERNLFTTRSRPTEPSRRTTNAIFPADRDSHCVTYGDVRPGWTLAGK